MRNGTIGSIWRTLTLGTLTVTSALLLPSGAGAGLIDFDEVDVGLVHGSIVDTQYLASLGVGISAVVAGRSPDLAVAFDTGERNTRDLDLEFPAGDYDNILILQENFIGCEDRVCDRPDDKGSRPAGFVEFSFDHDIVEFGLDLLDVEGSEELGSLAFFQGISDLPFATILFESFAGMSFGDHSVNTLDPIVAAELGVDGFDRVRVLFGGSGGLDNVRFEAAPVATPEPDTALLLGLGLAALAFGGRARR